MAPELDGGKSEARWAAASAVEAGMPDLPETTYFLEEGSNSILANLVNSAPLLEQKHTLIVVHRLQAVRAEYTARRLLLGNVSVLSLSEPSDKERARQEKLYLAVTAAILRGLSPGDIEEARQRVAKLERCASVSRQILSKTVLRNHTSLGS